MPCKAPEFWDRDGLLARLLAPAGWAHGAAGALRRSRARPWHAPVPVVCVGNLVAGGAGKTPVTIDLAGRLASAGTVPHILTRGYGGSAAGPLRVDPARHSCREVGDEALLLAGAASAWVARDRAAGARAAIAAGARSLLLDDGFQHLSLAQDLKLLVVDGAYGFGNGRVIPAGPLREPVDGGIARADAVVVMGEDRAGIAALAAGKPLLRARLAPRAGAPELRGARVLAFSGIGRPEKFFGFLEALGAVVVARRSFADHHVFTESELRTLIGDAERAGARCISTEKDWVRIPETLRGTIETLPIEVSWEDAGAIAAMLARLVERHPHG
ncbi:MAG: tetraacyldisaccharide 4'-kinase [Acidobacteriota bacterium]